MQKYFYRGQMFLLPQIKLKNILSSNLARSHFLQCRNLGYEKQNIKYKTNLKNSKEHDIRISIKEILGTRNKNCRHEAFST